MECNQRIICIFSILIIACAIIKTAHADEKLQSNKASQITSSPESNSTNQLLSQREKIRATYKDCAGLEILDEKFQPIYSPTQSILRKCCPIGQNIGTDEHDIVRCMAENHPFKAKTINASFYDNCIVDKETNVHLNYSIGYNCDPNSNEKDQWTLLYGSVYGDLLYVIQNGSLLRVDEGYSDYDVFNNYCLDMDRKSGELVAKVCISGPKDVFRAEAYLYCTCLWISVPCLLITAFLYLRIKAFRDLHGKSLASLSICFAIAYTLLSFAQIHVTIKLSHLIQYFLLASLCWLLILCFDICYKTWHLHKKERTSSSEFEAKMFVKYVILSFTVPLISVFLSMQRQIFGIPMYFIKSHHHFPSDHVNDSFFIMPAFILLGLCLVLKLITLYLFSTQNMTGIRISENGTIQPITNYDDYYTLKVIAINVTLLYTMMTVCMIIEFLVSYAQSVPSVQPELTPFSLIEIFIALQGVYIFIIFVCLPKPSRIVKRWWVASGSLDVAAITEQQTLKPNSNGMTQ